MQQTSNNPSQAKHSNLLAAQLGKAAINLFADVNPNELIQSLQKAKHLLKQSPYIKGYAKADRRMLIHDVDSLIALLDSMRTAEQEYYTKAMQYRPGAVIVPNAPSVQDFLNQQFA